jgi:NADH dehydrogenase FAD-containing subunit
LVRSDLDFFKNLQIQLIAIFITVVAGAGLIGQTIISLLGAHSSELDIVVIDPKEYFENSIGSVRALADVSFLDRITKPHSKWLPANATLVVGCLSEVSAKEATVKLPSGELKQVPFDFFIMATGHSYGLFKTNQSPTLNLVRSHLVFFLSTPHFQLTENPIVLQRKAELTANAEKIKAAQHVVIVGGGATGIEMAGEIRFLHPTKKITMVTSANRVLNEALEAASRKAMSILDEMNVEVILNERVELVGDLENLKSVKLQKSGSVIEADFIVRCIPQAANTDALKPHFAQYLAANGRVKVKRTLQFNNEPHMFAAGDITDFPGAGGAINHQNTAAIVSQNVLSVIRGKAPTETFDLTAENAKMPVVITVGPTTGIMSLNSCCTCAGEFATNLKRDGFMTKLPEDRQ